MKILPLLILFIFLVGYKNVFSEQFERINPFCLRNDEQSLLKFKKEIKEIKPTEEKEEVEKIEIIVEEVEKEEVKVPIVKVVSRVAKKKVKEEIPLKKILKKVPVIEQKQVIKMSSAEPSPAEPALPMPTPVPRTTPPEVIVKRIKDTKFRVINLISWGVFSLICIILLGVYINSKRKLQPPILSPILFKLPSKKSNIEHELRQLRIGYKGIERVIVDLEKKIEPIEELGGQAIGDFAKHIVKDTIIPIETELKKLQETNKDIELILDELKEKLLPIEELKGISIKELIRKISNQSAMEIAKPLEEKIGLMSTSQKRLFAEFEEKIDKKITQNLKKFKSVEKLTLDLEKKLSSINAQVATLSVAKEAEQIIGPREVKEIEIKEEVPSPKAEEKRAKLHDLVYKLADEGLSIDKIAEKTKLGKGEIKLILSLKKK
jgi:hypothetical protein